MMEAILANINIAAVLPYIQYQTARSGGSGGQHVNKVETKVILLFDVDGAAIFSEEEKVHIKQKLQNRLSADGLLQVSSQRTRSQVRNKEDATQKLLKLLGRVLAVPSPRKATKPSRAAVQRRLDTKRRQALRKINRRKDW